MKIRVYIFLLLTCLIHRTVYSQDFGNIQFIENKGQWDHQVKYMGQVAAGAFYVHEDGFTVLQHNAQDWGRLHDIQHEVAAKGGKQLPQIILRSHAYRMKFLNSKLKPTVIADKPVFTYNNYFIGNDPGKWASNCKVFQGITIKDVYPNVDVRYYSDKGSLKYDLIVNPGADINDIALKYDGADGLEVKNRQLVVRTSVGEMRELEPYSYQYTQKGKADVPVQYSLQGNVLRFKAKNYDSKSTLIIDPTIVFSSFTGSVADNWGFTATYGPDGSMFGGGIVFGTGFPVSPGAFQTNYGGGVGGGFGGGFDIGIMKLSPDGTKRIYATYIGGSGNEMPQSLIVDGQGNCIIGGRTNSDNYPTTGNPGVIGGGGSWDIIVTKLNPSGSALVGSKRIGGSGDDGANITPYGGGVNSIQRNYGDEGRSEVNIDPAGNIYLASCTQSNNFPTVNAFQTVIGGAQDGVVLKFDPTVSNLIFSSYFGGTGNDAAYVLSINPKDGNVFIGGGTESANLPGPSAGTIAPANNGGIDGFVSIINPAGGSIIATSYIGTNRVDQVFGIQFDKNGFPYIMGQTSGTWPIVNAAWSQANGKQFIAKLQPDLSAYVYSTCFGKGDIAPDISPVAFLVDRCENVYISGWGGKVSGLNYPTSGATGLPVTPDAFKNAPDVDANGFGQDFYFFVLKKNATAQLFGSYFGQNGGLPDHVDGGTSRFSPDGVIYQAVCANCYGNGTFPTTPGAWSTTNPSGKCNLAMVKIAFNLDGVRGGLQPSINGKIRDTAGCVPLTVDFKDTVQVAKSYEWYFGDGSPMVSGTSPNISHTYNTTGTFKVMMVAIDPDLCVPRDTTYTHIRVSDIKAALDFSINKLNPCDSFKYRFDNLSTASGGHTFGAQSFIWDFGDNSPRLTSGPNSVTHTYAGPGTYTVKLILKDTAFCNNNDSIVKQLRVSPFVKADFDTPDEGCVPYDAAFGNTSQGGAQFYWTFGDGGSSTQSSPTHTYAAPGTYTIKLVVVDSATCNISDSISRVLSVFAKPVADFNATPQPPSVNTPISFENLSSADATHFLWEFGDGDTLATTSRAVVKHEYNQTKTYNACLTVYNEAGCADKICKDVSNVVESAVDVPNAFTPQSGDINSKVFVRGFGIAKMKFTIWSRWGEKVFETDSKSVGWDGRYNGKLLPMDVYAYTLDVEFGDGTSVRRKGDITLIR